MRYNHLLSLNALRISCLLITLSVNLHASPIKANIFKRVVKQTEAKTANSSLKTQDSDSNGNGPNFSEGGWDDSNADNGENLQGELKSYDDFEFEWSQSTGKNYKAISTTYGLLLESGDKEQRVFSYTELPINLENDSFVFGALFNGKLSADKGIGLIFNFHNNKNYKALIFTQNQFSYIDVDKGETSIIKQGLLKTGKHNDHIIELRIENGMATVFFDTQDVTKIKNLQLTSPVMGIIIEGKTRALSKGFYFNILGESMEEEMSTTN